MLTQNVVARDEANLDACPADLQPTFLSELEYPGLPAGGGEPLAGWATIEFVVSEDGSTADARVVESSNRLFERGALRTILKSKYPPRSASCLHRLRLDFATE